MRILIVHNTPNDSKSVSGVMRHYCWVANELNALGHRVDFLAAKAAFPQLSSLAPTAKLFSSDNLFNATSYIAQTWRYFPAYGWRMVTARFTGFPQTYDVVYASAQMIFEVYPAIVLARRFRAKLVAKIHHVLSAQEKRSGLFDKLFLWSERVTARWLNERADLVICGTAIVSADFNALESRLGLKPTPTRQIGYGIDVAAITPSSEADKQFDAVVLGRMHQHKGVFDMAEVWAEVLKEKPEARLLMIGEGPHRQRATELFAQRGIAHSVVFTGGIPEEEKNRLLVQCRVGITPSYEEGWGLSVNEFLAAGLPVVGYHVPVFDTAFPGQLDLTSIGDKASLAQRILRLLKDPQLRKTRGEAGREFVKRYDFREVAREELRALEEALQPNNRRV